MNLLFVSTWFPYPPDNGSKLRVYYLLQALSKKHRVDLISFAFPTSIAVDTAPLLDCCERVEFVAIDPFAANASGLVSTFLSPAPRATRALPAMQSRLADMLAKQQYDAMIASTQATAAYALHPSAPLCKILEEHNSLTRWMKERYATQTHPVSRLRCWISYQKARRFEARLYHKFDLVTVVSLQDKATAVSELPGDSGRIEVVSNGVDCEHNLPNLSRPRLDGLVFNGSLTYAANYDAIEWFLLNVYPLIRSRRPTVSLTITGSTAAVDLAGLSLDDSVCLTGFVTDVRVPVAEAAVAVAPIRQGGGTRLKILEAMALGTPVVATTKGAEGLDVVDGQHLLLADTPQAFAAAVLGLLTDADSRARLALNARRLAESQYDWAAIGKRFVRLVEETVETRRMAPKSCARGQC